MAIRCIFFLMACMVCALPSNAQVYDFTLFLDSIQDDKVPVVLEVDKLPEKEVVYNIPKVVPGTYSISDFGRFINDFEALNKKGKKLPVKRLNDNQWQIKKAKKLRTIRYTVDDTWDSKKDNFIFEPAGTNLQAGKNMVINTYGFFGYFSGYDREPIRLEVHKPEGFYGSSAIIPDTRQKDQEVYQVSDYAKLADSPLMFTQPDTVTLSVGGAEVLISCYSPSNMMTAEEVGLTIAEILEAQRKYLGGTLPVDRYAFLFYFTNAYGGSGMMGALEHMASSVYFLPEANPMFLSSTIRDIAAHEFFHIVTPLNVHSEYIRYFDFIDPKMSAHLWLYEGVTEYSSSHVQVVYNLISPDDYYGVIREKINGASAYNDTLPFTEMSRQVLDTYQGEYGNVYEKGTLIALALDLQLLSLSEGKYSIRELMRDLSEAYGTDKAFADEALFDEIARISGYPKIREFFTRYVEGPEPLPLDKLMANVGIRFEASSTAETVSMGNILTNLDLYADTSFILSSVEDLDDFGRQMGYQANDIFVAINGTRLTLENIVGIISEIKNEGEVGDLLEVTVLRQNAEGGFREVVLSGNMPVMRMEQKNMLMPMEGATDSQLLLRHQWLTPREWQEQP